MIAKSVVVRPQKLNSNKVIIGIFIALILGSLQGLIGGNEEPTEIKLNSSSIDSTSHLASNASKAIPLDDSFSTNRAAPEPQITENTVKGYLGVPFLPTEVKYKKAALNNSYPSIEFHDNRKGLTSVIIYIKDPKYLEDGALLNEVHVSLAISRTRNGKTTTFKPRSTFEQGKPSEFSMQLKIDKLSDNSVEGVLYLKIKRDRRLNFIGDIQGTFNATAKVPISLNDTSNVSAVPEDDPPLEIEDVYDFDSSTAIPLEEGWNDSIEKRDIPNSVMSGIINNKPTTIKHVKVKKGSNGYYRFEFINKFSDEPCGIITQPSYVLFESKDLRTGTFYSKMSLKKSFSNQLAGYSYYDTRVGIQTNVTTLWSATLAVNKIDTDSNKIYGWASFRFQSALDNKVETELTGRYVADLCE